MLQPDLRTTVERAEILNVGEEIEWMQKPLMDWRYMVQTPLATTMFAVTAGLLIGVFFATFDAENPGPIVVICLMVLVFVWGVAAYLGPIKLRDARRDEIYIITNQRLLTLSTLPPISLKEWDLPTADQITIIPDDLNVPDGPGSVVLAYENRYYVNSQMIATNVGKAELGFIGVENTQAVADRVLAQTKKPKI